MSLLRYNSTHIALLLKAPLIPHPRQAGLPAMCFTYQLYCRFCEVGDHIYLIHHCIFFAQPAHCLVQIKSSIKFKWMIKCS